LPPPREPEPELFLAPDDEPPELPPLREPPLLELPLLELPPELPPLRELPPPLDEPLLFFAAPPLLLPEELRFAVLPLSDDDERDEVLFFAPPDELPELFLAPVERLLAVPAAAAAPATAPTAAPVAAALRREVLVPVFSPFPAVNDTVARSGMAISLPVRGLRPVRAARVLRVNLPKPGIENEPAA
jgi:hypothetical protein